MLDGVGGGRSKEDTEGKVWKEEVVEEILEDGEGVRV